LLEILPFYYEPMPFKLVVSDEMRVEDDDFQVLTINADAPVRVGRYTSRHFIGCFRVTRLRAYPPTPAASMLPVRLVGKRLRRLLRIGRHQDSFRGSLVIGSSSLVRPTGGPKFYIAPGWGGTSDTDPKMESSASSSLL
jgi:hypothetical protein